MSIAYVIHTDADQSFVEKTLARSLGPLGFDGWISCARADKPGGDIVIVVVPAWAEVTEPYCRQIEAALAGPAPVLALYLGQRNTSPKNQVLTALEKGPSLDVREMTDDAQRRRLGLALMDGMPRPAAVPAAGTLSADRVPWSEAVFSALLAESVRRHDYDRGRALLAALEEHLARRGEAYPWRDARIDLKTLRGKRQFDLMRRYAGVVLKSGNDDIQVRRQLGQALIELKAFEPAIDLLAKLAADTSGRKDDDGRNEHVEARGLLGRVRKQKYVDSGYRDRAELHAAIKEYRSVFDEDSQHVWHGINAATCILCSHRDGLLGYSRDHGQSVAEKVYGVLEGRKKAADEKYALMDVWDYATRVEALVDLDRFDEASAALDEYLKHPGMNAFEVSSTYRQFDEVMRLGANERGRPILERLAAAAERLRSGGVAPMSGSDTRAMLVRVADPSWTGAGIPDLTLHTRIGTVVSVTGSARTVQALMKDTVVIAVDESRGGGGEYDCVRSLPFIRVLEQYPGPAGNYSERGQGVLVAVIDNGIDVLHKAFLDDQGKSRIVGIWDQQEAAGPPPDGFTLGRYYGESEIAGFVANPATLPAGLARPSDGHGTHVTSIAAGRKTDKFAGGVAPDARILMVISGGNEPTGYSHTHMAALDFIDREATRLGMPVVVNLSQGMNTGAHDGLSPLEIAFDNFSTGGTRPGRAVVKSAGNERGKRGHAQFTVPAGTAEPLTWNCPPGAGEVRIEIWWAGFNEYDFTLQSPSGDASESLNRANPHVKAYFAGQGLYEMEFVPNHPQNGNNLLKLTINNGAGSFKANDWTLIVNATDSRDSSPLHAWIERTSRPASGFTTHEWHGLTLSIPGTARSVIAVGAIDAKDPIMVGTFSSYGPTFDGRPKPDVAAPGVGVFAAKRDTGDDVTEMRGTSMAAPHVAGAIALVFSKRLRTGGALPNASQLRSDLQRTTKNRLSEWNPGQGFGVIDVAKLLTQY